MIETFKPYILRFKWLLLGIYTLSILQTVLVSVVPMAGKVFIDYVLPNKEPLALLKALEKNNLHACASIIRYTATDIKGFILLASFFVLLLGAMQKGKQLLSFFLQNRMTAHINSNLFDRIMHCSLQKHQQYERGYLNARIMADSGAFESLARNLLPTLTGNVINFTFGVVVLSTINVTMTVICLIGAPFYILTNWLFSAKVRSLTNQSVEQSAANFVYVQNSLHGIETLKAFNLEATRSGGFQKRLHDLIDTRFRFFKISIFSSALARFAQIACLLLLLFFADNGYHSGELSVGDIVAFFSYMGFLSGPLSGMAMLYINLQPTLVSVRRVKEVLDFHAEDVADGELVNASARPQKLALKNICYSHNIDNSLFADLSLEIIRGKTLVIDWQSGIGKTTLARLLLKFLQPNQGQIYLDDVALSSINTKSLRAIIGYKPQADFFFAGSIKENLLIARYAADDELLIKALEQCCALEFVNNKSEGWDYQLTDGATNLSEGQRQRLALARVVLRDPEIVILDEPFAAIDDETSMVIMRNLQEFFLKRITIIMSHKKV